MHTTDFKTPQSIQEFNLLIEQIVSSQVLLQHWDPKEVTRRLSNLKFFVNSAYHACGDAGWVPNSEELETWQAILSLIEKAAHEHPV